MGDLPAGLNAALADKYAIEGELGRGGMATVYRARDLKHQRAVAVKVLRPELAAALGPERFLREIEIAAQLNHPHILPLFDSGNAGGFLYYVMPLVEGESLRDRLEREKQLPVDDALAITRAVAGALTHAHGAGILHRDIKPENILLSGGEAVVADFGIARALNAASSDRITQTGFSVGTPQYMSPEQASGADEVDVRSDLYSLGCVLYETLAGQPPFTGPTPQSVVHQHLAVSPRPVRALRTTVPIAVEQALERALAKVPSDRFATVSEFAQALSGDHADLRGTRWRPGRRTIVVGVAVALAVVASQVVPRRTAAPALDADLVAVAPFDVFAPELELWREGLVDLLSRNLNGAGPLRTVSPSVVMHRWAGRSDPASAAELGKRTGARLVLFGQLLRSGGDSARLTATLLDVANGEPLVPEIELRESSANADRLADSLTVTLLRDLGRTRPIGAVRSVSLGSTSLPAIKAYLRGEQFYRRNAFDSARAHYERAITLDSTFALALRRQALVLEGVVGGAVMSYRLRAGAHNRGLPPRDSLLVLVDSLEGASRAGNRGQVVPWPLIRRMFAVLDTAVARFPEDPEVWERLGDMGYHWAGGPTPRSDSATLEAMDRAIALDSGFVQGYVHAVELALPLRGPEAARRYLVGRAAASSQWDPETRLLDRLLDPRRAQSEEVARMLDTLSFDVLGSALTTLRGWPDSAETAIRVARAVASARHRLDPATDPSPSSALLAHRGHVREAYQGVLARGRGWRRDFCQLLLTGVVPPDSATAVFGGWLRARDQWGAGSLQYLAGAMARWWASIGDTASIRELAFRADSVARSQTGLGTRAAMGYAAELATAYLLLERGDTAAMLQRFETLPDTLCVNCFPERLHRVQLLSARRLDRQAAALLEHKPSSLGVAETWEVFWVLERARVHDRLGNRAQAIADYRFVADVWRHADPELQPIVAEARAALKRLRHDR